MKRYSQWIILALSLVIAIASYFYISHALNAEEKPRRFGPPKAQEEESVNVSVVTVSVGAYSPSINVSGIVKPRYSLTLTSRISGEVIRISNNLESGKRVKKGDLLVTLNNPELNSSVASAQKTLASAELALKEEKRQGEQALAEWKAAGFEGQPDSDLVLRIPQLDDAKATVNAAKAALVEAQDNLKHTRVLAPFDALIVSSDIAPGSYLNSGGQIASLYSTDRAEVTLELASSDWLKLPAANQLLKDKWPVTIKSIDTPSVWKATVLNVGQHVDTATRMRSLTVGLNAPLDQSTPLLPGEFVTVQLQGKTIENLWKLPNSALSQRSEIWYLDDESRFDSFDTTPLFVDARYIYIRVPEEMRASPYAVLVKPYNSYLRGTLANPMEQPQ